MRIPDLAWQELRAALDDVDTYAALAGLLEVSEKTAKAWVEDRTREVREAKLARALGRLRSRLNAERTKLHAKASGSIDRDTQSSAGHLKEPHPEMSYPDLESGNIRLAEGEWMNRLTPDGLIVFGYLLKKDFVGARDALDEILGEAQPKARSRLHRSGRKK